MKVYNVIRDNCTEVEALEWAHGFVWCDCESGEIKERPSHSRHVESFDGVGVWYDFAADYYFFEDESEDDQ